MESSDSTQKKKEKNTGDSLTPQVFKDEYNTYPLKT